MLRTSLMQSLRGMGIDGQTLGNLTRPQVAQLRGILTSGDSDGIKAFRARAFFEKTER